jgi:hypothetical protein
MAKMYETFTAFDRWTRPIEERIAAAAATPLRATS